jgi:hypothetical protein
VSDINYSINVSVQKGEFQQQFFAPGRTATMGTVGMLAVTLQLGTATSAVSTSSASALGYAFARSLATAGAATISLGRVSGTILFETVRLKAGDAAWFRMAPGNYAARASAEGTPLLLQILEE